VLTLHCVRQGFVAERTAFINRLRSLLAGFGIVIAQGANRVRCDAAKHFDQLSHLAVRAVKDLLEDLHGLEARVSQYDQEEMQLTRENYAAQRLQSKPGERAGCNRVPLPPNNG
jgi:transposase